MVKRLNEGNSNTYWTQDATNCLKKSQGIKTIMNDLFDNRSNANSKCVSLFKKLESELSAALETMGEIYYQYDDTYSKVESKLRTRKRSIKEGVRNTLYYDPELEQFEIFLMTRGTDGQDEIRDYVDSRRDTGIFGSIGSEYGNISVWVNTESIDDEFMDEVEALIDFAQDHGARLNVKCFNELKDLFTVKQAPYDI